MGCGGRTGAAAHVLRAFALLLDRLAVILRVGAQQVVGALADVPGGLAVALGAAEAEVRIARHSLRQVGVVLLVGVHQTEMLRSARAQSGHDEKMRWI